MVEVAVADEFAGQEGYFESGEKADSSPDSMNEGMQKKLWSRSIAWSGLKAADTIISV